jgi:hypothetical protein
MSSEPTAAFFAILMAGGFAVTAMILSIPIYAIWTYHKRKLEEIRARKDVQIAEDTRAAINGLREEFRELRDNSSAFDVSLDNAVQRLERRIENLEQRNRYASAIDEPVQIQSGRQ